MENIISQFYNTGISNIIYNNINIDYFIDYLLLKDKDTLLITTDWSNKHSYKFVYDHEEISNISAFISNILTVITNKTIIIEVDRRYSDLKNFYNISKKNNLKIIIITKNELLYVTHISNFSIYFQKDVFRIIKTRYDKPVNTNKEYQISDLYSHITRKLREEKLKRLLEVPCC